MEFDENAATPDELLDEAEKDEQKDQEEDIYA